MISELIQTGVVVVLGAHILTPRKRHYVVKDTTDCGTVYYEPYSEKDANSLKA